MKQGKRRNTKIKNKKTAPSKNPALGFYLFFGLLLTFLPLVYYRDGLDPALHPRMLFLSVMLALGMGILFWMNRKQVLKTAVLHQYLFYLLGAYFLITAISVVFAINPREGNYDINKSFLVLALVAISSLIFINTKEWHQRLPVLVFIPAIILILVGFYEYNQNMLLIKGGKNSQGMSMLYEVRALMAHKNQFAIALLMFLPFLGYSITQKGGLRIVSIILTILVFLLIVLIKTRSVWVGLAVAVVVGVFFVVFFGNQLNLKKNIRLVVGGLSLILFLVLIATVYYSDASDSESITAKLKNITNPTDQHNIHRINIWEISGKMIKDHPVQGVGAGNWKINSAYYYSGYGFDKDQLNWLRPHNDYIWVFAEKGIFGFVAFLGIFLLAIFYLVRTFFSSASTDKKVFALFVLSGFFSYMAVSFFSFPLERMNHQVYLGIMLAAAISLYHQEVKPNEKPVNLKILALPVLLMLLWSTVYSKSVLEMENKVKNARALQMRGQWDEMLDLAYSIPSRFKTLDAEAMPLAWYRGLAYANMKDVENASLAYAEAREDHPTRIAVLNNLGQTYFQMGEYEKAKDIFLESLYILPEYFEALVNVSSSYIQLGNYEKAYEYLSKIPRKKMNDPLKGNMRFVRKKLRESGKLPAQE